MKNKLKQIEGFWNKNLCGKHFIAAKYPSKEFFEQYRDFRYKKEHHLNYLIDWKSARNKDILEIGLGVGADGTRWAEQAKSYSGIDLTNEAVIATKLHFKHLGLDGYIIKGNVESLPYSDNKFDIIYSHGVLHHTLSLENALIEINRVLKLNGQLIIMLYTKYSFNYWVRIQFYFRLRFLSELFKLKLGLKVTDPWRSHIKNYQKIGRLYFSWHNWPHRCTDGPGCEIANIYYTHEIKKYLDAAGFCASKLRKAHFPIGGKHPALELFLAKYVGFYQFAWANKIQNIYSATRQNHNPR